MKGVILKVSIFAILTFSGGRAFSEILKYQNIREKYIELSLVTSKISHKTYEKLSGFDFLESFAAHYVGLSTLFETCTTLHTIENSILKHPYYSNKTSQNPFKIRKDGNDYIISNGVGVRHFTVKEYAIGKTKAPVLFNGNMKIYPDIESFISSCKTYNFFA